VRTWSWRFVLIAIVLVAFGNVADLGAGRDVLNVSWVGVAKAVGTLLIVLAAARWSGMPWREMGIARAGSTRSALIGIAAGFALAILTVTALHFAARVTYRPVQGETVTALILHAFVGVPLLTALPEELAFRGLLLGLAMRQLSPVKATALVSAVFVAWHLVIQAQTLALTNLAGPWMLTLAWGAALAGLFAGGLGFAFLRLSTHNLAGAVTAHWLFVAVLGVGLYLT
jgi:membrane protease YdiL (CAAX protease family)